MAQQHGSGALLTLNTWREWEGRIVGGRYQLGRYLGGSDCSAVYLTDFGGSRAVVKLIAAETPDAQTQLSRWEAARNLVHPNLLRTFDTGRWHADEEQDMFFVVMEFADENLGEILRERPLTPVEVQDMLTPTLAALDYLHQQHLVHSDLKPANVLAVGQELKLAPDGVRRFGSRLAGREQEDKRAAPEVLASGVSAKDDVWAVGLLILESLHHEQALADTLKGNRASSLDTLPQPFADIVRECLREDPGKRCSIAEIRHMLSRPLEIRELDKKTAADPKGNLSTSNPAQSEPTQAQKTESKPESAIPVIALTGIEAGAVAGTMPKTHEPKIDLDKTTAPRQRNSDGPLDPKPHDEEAFILRKSKFASFAVAILLGLAAVVLLVLFLRGAGDRKTRSIAAQPPAQATSTAVPEPMPTSKPFGKSVSAAVAHEVTPEVSRAAQNSIHGVVKVRVQVNVNEAGKVAVAGLAAHGPSRYFAGQALDAARQWTFTPPVVDGKAIASRWILEFDFRRSGIKTESRMIQPKV
jgi:TonB family protein